MTALAAELAACALALAGSAAWLVTEVRKGPAYDPRSKTKIKE
jgi:hypothetical protein